MLYNEIHVLTVKLFILINRKKRLIINAITHKKLSQQSCVPVFDYFIAFGSEI